MNAKKLLKELLLFYIYKIDNNLCTSEEIESACKVLLKNMPVSASISDMAKFFDVSEVNVRALICRKLTAAPVRKTQYPFHLILPLVPKSWLSKKELQPNATKSTTKE